MATSGSSIAGGSAAEIADSIRAQVQAGALAPGAGLPPVRELAARLQVNRNTVAAAYQRLTRVGILVSQGRHGTAVAAPAEAGAQEGGQAGSPLVDLASGNPNPDWLADPVALLGAVERRPRLYGAEVVNPGLAALARAWLDPDCPPGYELTLSHGAVDAIERLAAAHLVPGDKVAVEDPCYMGCINALRLAGMQAQGVAIDEAGMRPEALAQRLAEGARAVVVTPRAHNPTGCSLTAARARALARLLARHPGVLVIVDDHFGLVARSPFHTPIPTAATRWALVRSVSKALGPDLRLAFVASDAGTAQRLRARLAPGMTWVSHLLQDLVQAGLGSEAVRGRIEAARSGYVRRGAELVAALAARDIAALPPADGVNVWVPVAGSAREVAHAMARRGWLVRSGDAFAVEQAQQAVRITVATLADGQAARVAADLADCLAA